MHENAITWFHEKNSKQYSQILFIQDVIKDDYVQELEEEFEDKILFGFLEGIWYLDIIYQVGASG